MYFCLEFDGDTINQMVMINLPAERYRVRQVARERETGRERDRLPYFNFMFSIPTDSQNSVSFRSYTQTIKQSVHEAARGHGAPSPLLRPWPYFLTCVQFAPVFCVAMFV